MSESATRSYGPLEPIRYRLWRIRRDIEEWGKEHFPGDPDYPTHEEEAIASAVEAVEAAIDALGNI